MKLDLASVSFQSIVYIVNINAGKPSNTYDWPEAVWICLLKKKKAQKNPNEKQNLYINNNQLDDKLKLSFSKKIIRFK